MNKFLLLGLILTFPPLFAGWSDVGECMSQQEYIDAMDMVITCVSVNADSPENVKNLCCDIEGCKEKVCHLWITQDTGIVKKRCAAHKEEK